MLGLEAHHYDQVLFIHPHLLVSHFRMRFGRGLFYGESRPTPPRGGGEVPQQSLGASQQLFLKFPDPHRLLFGEKILLVVDGGGLSASSFF